MKLAHQEYELLQLLKRIPLTSQMKGELLLRAEQLSSGLLKSRGDALLPLTLATFIFESLCTPGEFYHCCQLVSLVEDSFCQDHNFCETLCCLLWAAYVRCDFDYGASFPLTVIRR